MAATYVIRVYTKGLRYHVINFIFESKATLFIQIIKRRIPYHCGVRGLTVIKLIQYGRTIYFE